MLLQQQKHRAQILQKQLEQMDALKWQIIEKKRQEQMKQQQQERQMLLQQQQLKQAKGVTKPDVKLDIKPEIVTASRTESRSKSNHKHKKHKKSSKLSQGEIPSIDGKVVALGFEWSWADAPLLNFCVRFWL